jgi:hypothetical protein
MGEVSTVLPRAFQGKRRNGPPQSPRCNRDDLVGIVHFFVTPREEFFFDFIEAGAEPLMTPRNEMSINDIVEAFLFKELYSYGSI